MGLRPETRQEVWRVDKSRRIDNIQGANQWDVCLRQDKSPLRDGSVNEFAEANLARRMADYLWRLLMARVIIGDLKKGGCNASTV